METIEEDYPGQKNDIRRAMLIQKAVHAADHIIIEENRVHLQVVDAKYTSQTCPSCGWVARENRKGEKFQCVCCNYSADADHVGALNILAKTFGNSQESTVPECASVVPF